MITSDILSLNNGHQVTKISSIKSKCLLFNEGSVRNYDSSLHTKKIAKIIGHPNYKVLHLYIM